MAAPDRKLVQPRCAKWLVPAVRALTADDIAYGTIRGGASDGASGGARNASESKASKAREAREAREARMDASDPHAAEFAKIAADIAAAKTPLDDIPADVYDELARELDLYSGLKYKLRRQYGMPVVTNATLKIIEMLNELPAVPTAGPLAARAGGIRAFCNAELPGAFLVGLNQYAKQLPAALDWVASSYLPDRAAGVAADETILDDKYGLYAANPERWLMRPAGADASAESALASSANLSAPDRPRFDGDMTEPVGVVTAAGLVRERFVGPTGYGATLYTSDAGIDVSADYNRQEESTAVLNFGQVLCGLLALAPGGALITKQYTFATPFSRQLLMIVASAFERTHIVKPRTSRPANSEVYLFGEGFRGLPADVAARLVMCLAAAKSADEARSPLPPLLRHGVLAAPDADRALLRISHSLAQVQIRYLREIVAVFDGCGRQPERAREVARAFAAGAAAKAQRSWLAANPLVRLAPSDQIKAARL